MRAVKLRLALAAVTAFVALAPVGAVPAMAQEAPAPAPTPTAAPTPTPKVTFTLAQDAAPGSKPWTEAGLFSYTIDRKGKDFYSIQLNGEANFRLDTIGRTSLGPSISYKRSSAETAPKDALEAGLVGKTRGGPKDPGPWDFFYSATANIAYARSGIYPDRTKAPCDTDTTSVFCRKQYSESVKGSVDFYPFIGNFERYADPKVARREAADTDDKDARALAWSFSPRIGFAHDEVLDGAVDPVTRVKVTGGYTSVLVGAGLKLTPGFVNPPFELNLTGTVRRRLGASPGRTDLTDRTEARMQISATYFIVPESEKGWRAGISVVWTEGGDSFEAQPKESTIVLAFRIGHF